MARHILDDGLWADEVRLENEARSAGIAKYREMVAGSVHRLDGGQLRAVERMLVHWFTPLRHLIAAEKKAISEGRPGLNRRVYGPVLVRLNSAHTAVTTLHETMSLLLAEPLGVPPVRICLAIARGLNGEVNYREMRRIYSAVSREAREAGQSKPVRHWAAVGTGKGRRGRKPRWTNKIAARYMPGSRWPIGLQTQIGARLLELLDRVASLDDYDKPLRPAIHKVLITSPVRRKHWWRLTDDALNMLDDAHGFRQLLAPKYMPMVVPPLKWTADCCGGYVKLPTTLIKRSGRLHGMAQENEQVREALNYINSTPWRVNGFILDVVRKLAETGGDIAGVPRLTRLDMPPKPPDWDIMEDMPRKAWKKHIRWVAIRNNEITSIARSFFIKLDVANRVRPFKRFYFPHQLDFRTRMYPLPVLFHHQGDDVCRGMLEFADGRDCRGERAQWWLKVHLANCCGQDKEPFEGRLAWTEANMETFAGWVDKPLENTGWMEVDEPFQALAAARAVLNPEHGAHLPVGIDGSNNALQHYAAMVRCPDAAAMVNVIPSDRPQDFYALVADRVRGMVGRDADAGNATARQLDEYITRRLVKHTAMTNYYGVTQVGARRQMYGNLREAGFLPQELYRASQYLSRVVLKATEAACPSVQAVLLWLRECARRITTGGQSVQWTTPLGIGIEQPYRNSHKMQVATPFGRLYLAHREDDCPPAVRKQMNSFPPNFVHSIDASHLMCGAICCIEPGIRFAGVHDKVLTHAADMDALGVIMREQFAVIHESPLLEGLAEELADQADCPPCPPMGDLDIQQAVKSPYLFA